MVERRPESGIVVVGAGLIGRRHAELAAANDRASLVAIVDPDPAAAALASRLETRWLPDLEEALREVRPDGAIIATPNELHAEHAIGALRLGVAVMVEKPIATSLADGEMIAREAERLGVPLLVGHQRRHSPYLAAARAAIRRGDLGRIVTAAATTTFAKPEAYFAAAPWRQAPGGGPILINLIHDVDALRFLVGEITAVRALASNAVRQKGVEESVAVALTFANGAVGTMLLSDAAAAPISWEMTSGEDPVYPRYLDRDCYVISGTRGTLGIPTMRLTTAMTTGEASWHEPMRASTLAVEPADPLARQLDHFLDVIAGTADPLVTARDAVGSLAVTLDVAAAAGAGAASAHGRAP
jgi:predicted dehydrogenase